MRLERLSTELSDARDEDSWWNTLVAGALSLELVEVRWTGPSGTRSKIVAPEMTPAWSFRTLVTDTDFIEISGAMRAPSASFDLMRFAETMKKDVLYESRGATGD